MARSQGKILVIRGGAIGDFILTFPVLSALRAQFPEVHLEILGYPRVTPLALAGGLVDQARSIDARPLASFFARNGVLPDELAEYFASFGVIVSYLYDPDRIFQENVARCSKAQFLAGPHRPDETGTLHATEALQPLRRLAIFDPDPTPRLDLSQGVSFGQPVGPATHPSKSFPPEPALPGQPRLALHPGSGSERKNWAENNWRQLLERLAAETSCAFSLVGGEAEGDRLARLASILPPDRVRLARNLPLDQLAFLLRDSQAYLGHDSGISHLAAALSLPGLVLWVKPSSTFGSPVMKS